VGSPRWTKGFTLKILFLDIETSPIIAHVWGLWDNNVALNQIEKDWHLLSWCGKWRGSKKVMYMDQSQASNIQDDKKILKEMWKLLDDADVVVHQNGTKFDIKKLNARFILNGMQPPSSFKQMDTFKIAKKYFGFTSFKLEYMSDKLNKKYKKLKHKKFPGHEMWVECLKGNKKAWKAMRKYNIYDVLALEELYNALIPWDTSVNFSIYNDEKVTTCSCGSTDFQRNGFFYSSTGKFQRYRCAKCGAEARDRKSVLSKEKKASLKVGTKR
jgi:RNase_H superfamily